jgi:hypothetical protein
VSKSERKINNTFKDRTTGLSFLIPFSRQLNTSEAEEKVRRSTVQQKARLFTAWKARKQNQNWKGDENAKREELFEQFYSTRRGSDILLFEHGAEN